jgi:oxygen-dependent protoporphyrinogen oxidase
VKALETLIVGGGISGLSAAWQINRLGQDVTLWEAEPRLGGKIVTNSDQGYTTEQSASMVLNFRPEVSHFLEESGLNDQKLLRTPTSMRYLISQGNLQNIPMKMGSMLFSPLWSLSGKLRLMLEPFILKGAAEHESVADFIRRRLGNEMLDKALGAYISGTLASDPELADSLSVLPHLTALERRYGSLTAGVFARKVLNRKKAAETEGFSFRGGMSTLISELSRPLRDKINTGYSIQHIGRHGKHWLVSAQTRQGEQSCLVKNLVLCTPAAVSARLLRQHNPELSTLLDGIEYASVSVVHLGYHKQQIKHPLQGTGFLTPWHEKLKLNGSMWIHSLFPGRTPKDHVLLSNYLGGARHPEIAGWTHQMRIDSTCHELKNLIGTKGEPDWARVDAHQRALPLYHGKYHLRQQMIANQLHAMPGLHLNANYLGGVSIRDRIISAQNLALTLSEHTQYNQANTPLTAARRCCA